jgi:hypothetical protein
MIIEGRFQVFQRFSSGKLVLKAVESCFMALNYYGNGSTARIALLTVTPSTYFDPVEISVHEKSGRRLTGAKARKSQ